jgi:D-xylose 1-dehydrogenase (NADP+, D-xylono-1,5-lactone-forming)
VQGEEPMLNEDRAVRWGVLGCARIAETAVIPGIQGSINGRVLAIASRDVGKARGFAEKFAIPKAYGSYEELLEDPEIQAVYIPLPNSMHKEWTILAAEKGKHVLCEKPIACCAADAREMAETCRELDVLLMEAFAHRFHPQYRKVEEWIRQGSIGRIKRISASMSRSVYPAENIRMIRSLCGGALMDLGCYCINTARHLVGSEPVTASARQDVGSTGVDERTTGTLWFPGGEVLQFDTNLYLEDRHFEQGLTVFGETGNIHVHNAFTQLELLRFGRMAETMVTLTDTLIGGHREETVRIEAVHQWRLEAEFFADRILTGRPVELPGENGVANMRAIDAVVESARTGRLVEA